VVFVDAKAKEVSPGANRPNEQVSPIAVDCACVKSDAPSPDKANRIFVIFIVNRFWYCKINYTIRTFPTKKFYKYGFKMVIFIVINLKSII
jgi:hypothetical protein